MESINLILQKYVWKVELSIKLLPYSPQSNGKKKLIFEGNDQCITYKFWFTTKLVWRNYPYCKREQQKVLPFHKESNKKFCFSRTQSMPYEKWKWRKSNLKYFKVWGCLAKVQVPIPKRIKIGPKTVDCNNRLE